METSASRSTASCRDPTRVTAERITWFRSSEKVQRGFCARCGSALFWDPLGNDFIGIAMGAFESPAGTRLRIHVHVADQGDDYEIMDGLPQKTHESRGRSRERSRS